MRTLKILRHEISRGDILGCIPLLYKILRSKIFSRRELVFVMSPSDLERVPEIEVPGYKVEPFASWDMIEQSLKDQFVQNKRYYWWDVKTMLSDGACLWAGCLNGKLASISWSWTSDKDPFCNFPLSSDCISITHSVTFPEYRGLGLYPATLRYIVGTLAEEGFNHFYGEVTDWNTASIRGVESAGFRFIGRAKLKRNGTRIWYPQRRP